VLPPGGLCCPGGPPGTPRAWGGYPPPHFPLGPLGPAELGRGEFDSDADQADAEPVDAGLGAGTLPGPQHEPPEVAKRPAERPLVASHLEGGPHLAENLVLAHDHRVEPAGHRKQVLDRAVRIVHVEASGELAGRDARVAGQQLAYPSDTAVETVHLCVDLDPVAG
jgi:hypothetical protein